MNNLENRLSEHFQKEFCCFTGSGTTSIYLILKSLNLQHKKILYPAITCMAPVNAAIYAGYEPIFCDVNLDNYTMDINSLKNIIQTGDIGIIVPTHIYGHRCNMKIINDIAKKNNIFVLEDAAQSYYFEEADAAIISFGHTKIFQCEGGGGAVFTNDEKLYDNIVKCKRELPKRPSNIDILFDLYREDYYNIIKKYKDDDMYYYMRKLQLDNEKTFIYDLPYNANLFKVLDNAENIINERIKRRKIYDKYLNKNYIDLPLIDEYEGLWRYTFLYKGNREKLLKNIREKGVDISSWYINLKKIYKDTKCCLKNAEEVENCVVNLWLDERNSIEFIKRDADFISLIMNEIQ
ncbi:DegT/DnrJ/EryC1/StrS family aminotransferase [Clostridium sporogenes]|uniref:DegT/DnrJ/EryC1/StrS family aminotransferase n=1 Tax=Clostridium sporogenes TaxID=1509 RepID=UPI003DA2A433